MGIDCSSCTGTSTEQEIDMLEDGHLEPNVQAGDGRRHHIASQHLDQLPDKYKAAQYVLDQSKSDTAHKVYSNPKMQAMLQSNLKSIIRIQAMVRRICQRKSISEAIELRDMYRMHARYFTRDELFETLKPVVFSFDKTLERNTHHYKNGGHYEGTWLGGFRHGEGQMVWADGATYKGTWDMGYADGEGIFTDCLDNRYVGSFKLSMAHGKGSYTNTLGATYQGEWNFDMQHGQGVEHWLDSGSRFTGQFVNGLRQGYGEWLHNGKHYKGDWRNGQMDGQGTMEWGIS